MPHLTTAYRVLVRNAPLLATLPLSNLATLDSSFALVNLGMTSITLPSLTEIAGDLSIESHATLTSIAFPVLAEIGSLNVWISSNTALTSIDLHGVTTVPYLTIVNNVALANVDGFSGFTTIGTRLVIQGNGALADLDGLFGLTAVGGELTVKNNPTLPTAEALALRDEIGIANIAGPITISGNAP